jgi:hypothetical protein
MPFRLPWLLRHVGPMKASIFYADLGGDQNFPHPYFVGYKFSILPSDRVELGVAVYTKAGGHGSPRASFSARVVDAFPFLDAAFYGGLIGTRGKYEFSDRYAGVDGRWRLPRLASAELYWELLLNDFDVRRLRSVLWEDAGHIAGVVLPRLTASGRLGATLELHHTGLRYYEHHQFTSGQTLHRILIGDALGPDALGAFATVDWYASTRSRLSIDAAVERRSSDRYSLREGPGFGFQRVQSNPREGRARLTVSWRTPSQHEALGFLTQAGLEHTRNFDFVRGVQRTALLGRAALEYRFR